MLHANKSTFLWLFFFVFPIFTNVFFFLHISTTSPHTHVLWRLPQRWLSQQTFAGHLSASWSACTSAAAWTSARPSRYGRYACSTPDREEERVETWERSLDDTIKGRAMSTSATLHHPFDAFIRNIRRVIRFFPPGLQERLFRGGIHSFAFRHCWVTLCTNYLFSNITQPSVFKLPDGVFFSGMFPINPPCPHRHAVSLN